MAESSRLLQLRLPNDLADEIDARAGDGNTSKNKLVIALVRAGLAAEAAMSHLPPPKPAREGR